MKTLKRTFKINAEITDVYAAFTNPVTIELWSGHPAIMETKAGAEFSMWGGDITGMVIEALENKKLVQEWYFGDQAEKSVVTIYFLRDYGSTQVTLEHTNIPDKDFNNISEGWDEYYLGAIQQFFNPNF